MLRNSGFQAPVTVRSGPVADPIRDVAAPGRAGAASFGADLGAAADHYAGVREKLADRRRAVDLLRARTGAAGELADLAQRMEEDTDWRTVGDRYEKEQGEIRARWRKGLDVEAVEQYDILTEEKAGDYRRRVLARGLAGLKDEGRANLDGLEAQALRDAAAADTPERRAAALNDYRGALRLMADTGVVDRVDAGKRDRAFLGRADEQDIQSLMNKDPEAAVLALTDSNRFQNIDGVQRERLSRMALGMAEARSRDADIRARRADAQAEKDLKRRGEDEAKRLDQLQADGKLNREEIERSRAFLSPSDYRHYLTTISKPAAAADDLPTYAGFERRLEIEDIAGDVVREQAAGRLTPATAKSLIERNRQAMKDDRPASPYRSGRELVKATLDPGQLLSGGAADAARAGMASALVEFDAWADANRGADRAVTMDTAREIVGRYQLFSYEKMSVAVGLPRSYTGTRDRLAPADLDAAEARTIADLDAGRLSKEQASIEIRKIENWREILSRKPAAAPAAKPGGK